uniref:Uncharacterized protein n=1 Tax=Phytophthora ramorum TaxID=164328 RepID=H3GRI2_PHYRM
MVSETYLRKALAHTKTKYASVQDAHSQLQAKHALLEGERNDQEADVWLWMMQHDRLQAKHKKLQDEHAQWKGACAALMEEVERKFLEEDYMAELAQQYGQSRWHVAKVAELEVELQRKLAETQQLAKEREQALTDKVAALESEVAAIKAIEATSKSEVANLSSAMNQIRADFAKSRLSSEETADRLTKELAEAKAETEQHVEATNTLRSQMTALLTSAKTAVTSWEAAATKKKLVAMEAPEIVKVPTQTQPRCVQRREVELTETLVRLEKLKLSGETAVRSNSTTKTAAAPVKLAAQRLQQSKETKSAAKKESFGWASKTKRLAPSPSPTSSSPQRSRRSAA